MTPALTAPFAAPLSLVVLVRSWPSRGITPAAPLYGLKDEHHRTVARSRDRAALLRAAAANYSRVAAA